MRGKSKFIIPLLLAGVVVLFQYCTSEKVSNPETGRRSRVALSSEQEETLGLQSYREVLQQSQVIPSGPEYDMVKRVAERLAPTTGEAAQHFKWQVSLVQSPQVNAFCLPGGKIVVFTGILPYTKTEAGLAAVMGHEMAHAVARHGSQRMLRTTLANTLMTGANFSLGDLDPGQRQAVLAALGAGAQFGLLLPFGREHETEADEMGLLYMARAGYDPREAVAFWERMGQVGGQQPPEFASTHPSHGRRIEDLKAFMPKALAEFNKNPGR